MFTLTDYVKKRIVTKYIQSKTLYIDSKQIISLGSQKMKFVYLNKVQITVVKPELKQNMSNK